MESGCDFCYRDRMGRRIIAERQRWYAFVPEDPRIFGHIILTVDPEEKGEKHCVHDIWNVEDEVLSGEIIAARDCMRGLKEIPFVERVYLVVAGESERVHHHYHLIPRYKRHLDWKKEDVPRWKKKCELKEGDSIWRSFYNDMPRKMHNWRGFQYLGELEHEYNDFRTHSAFEEGPGLDILEDMAGKVETFMGSVRLDDH